MLNPFVLATFDAAISARTCRVDCARLFDKDVFPCVDGFAKVFRKKMRRSAQKRYVNFRHVQDFAPCVETDKTVRIRYFDTGFFQFRP
jgi:hypothetical protein